MYEFKTAVREGLKAIALQSKYQWKLGDIAASTKAEYGDDTMAKLAEALYLNKNTLMNYRTSAGNYAADERDTGNAYSIYEIFNRLDDHSVRMQLLSEQLWTSKDANAKVKADVTVEPGKLTEATVKQTGAKTTFKLVQTLGGEALADTKWKIFTSAGDVVKENAGALPTHILAAGSYAVIAEHGGLNYTRKFSIEGVEAKQIEVVVDDGPTSPDDLKALTDPPEPAPPPSGGTLAGDGEPSSSGSPALGFDGFSATRPADPNMPLINPGALLRPAR